MDIEREQRERALIDAVILTPEQEASIDEAMKNARDLYPWEIAVSARFDRPTNMVIFVLANGHRLPFPGKICRD